MGYKTIERGYYWVKFYNHERKMILFYTGVFWEQFKHDDRIHDEIESYERVEEPSSVPQANELLPHVSAMLPDLDIDKAEELAWETDYACFAVEEDGNEINKADAGAFFLEGYNYAKGNLR